MKFKATFNSFGRDYSTGRRTITFDVIDANLDEAEKLNGKTLWIDAREYEVSKSTEQNRYMWSLIDKIGHHKDILLHRSDVYELMLDKYGLVDGDDLGNITIKLLKVINPSDYLGGHWRLDKAGSKYNYFTKIRGTSEYSKKELNTFISHLVEECKELGIETLPPDELRRMQQLWETQSSRAT